MSRNFAAQVEQRAKAAHGFSIQRLLWRPAGMVSANESRHHRESEGATIRLLARHVFAQSAQRSLGTSRTSAFNAARITAAARIRQWSPSNIEQPGRGAPASPAHPVGSRHEPLHQAESNRLGAVISSTSTRLRPDTTRSSGEHGWRSSTCQCVAHRYEIKRRVWKGQLSPRPWAESPGFALVLASIPWLIHADVARRQSSSSAAFTTTPGRWPRRAFHPAQSARPNLATVGAISQVTADRSANCSRARPIRQLLTNSAVHPEQRKTHSTGREGQRHGFRQFDGNDIGHKPGAVVITSERRLRAKTIVTAPVEANSLCSCRAPSRLRSEGNNARRPSMNPARQLARRSPPGWRCPGGVCRSTCIRSTRRQCPWPSGGVRRGRRFHDELAAAEVAGALSAHEPPLRPTPFEQPRQRRL